MNSNQHNPVRAVAWRRRALAVAAGGVCSLLVALAGCSSGDDEVRTPTRTVQFQRAEMVKAAPVLTGDPTNGRCADSTAPCFKNNHDFLNGQRRLLRIEDVGVAARTHNAGAALDYFLGGLATTTNSGVATVAASSLTGALPTDTVSSPAVAAARLFNGDRDGMVSAAVGTSLNVAVDRGTGLPMVPATDAGLPSGSGKPTLLAATADFVGEGWDDVVFATSRPGLSGTLRVMSAVDPDDAGKGLRFGPRINVNPMLAVAAGNFLGTGNMVVIAVAAPEGKVLLQYFAVDPTSRQFSLQQSLTLDRPGGAPPASVSIAVGRFNAGAVGPIGHDQMVIAVSDSFQTDLLSVDSASASGTAPLTPVQRLQGKSDAQLLMRPVLRAGRFDWSSPFDGVALLLTDISNVGSPSQIRLFTVFTLDANLDVRQQTQDYEFSAGQCIYDMQVGNFDRRKPDPTPNAPPGSTLHDPNLQILFLSSNATNSDDGSCSGGDSGDANKGMTLSFYDVNAGTDGVLSVVNGITFVWSSFTEARLREASLAVPDLQGRSLMLGAPLVLVQPSDQQVDLVLAAPPMHADFIGAGGNLLNLSVAPKGFTAGFQFTSSSDQNSTSTNSTSSTFSTEETIDAKLTYGVCGGTNPACGSIEDKASLKQAHDSSTAALTGTFGSQSTSLSAGTVFHDQVLWSDRVLTFYVYPVLGRTQCPASKPDCPDNEQVPVTATFAGPDTVQRKLSDGGSMNWYQPPWMPGNMLSYPGNRSQLEQAAYPQLPGALQPLSADTVGWSTDEGSGSQQTQWRSGATAGSTVSHSGSFSYNNTTSLGVQVTPPLGAGISLNLSVSESGSKAWSHLSDSKQTLSQSSGLTFTKGAQFARPTQYQYGVQPIIFGQLPPPSASDASASNAGNDLSTWGALRTAYIVDPLGGTEGSMWRSGSSTNPYRAAPDVAFNHPDRWTHKAWQNDLGDGTCLFVPSADLYECVSLTRTSPADPVSDDYHRMRGFFITGAEGNGSGAQLASATAGDKLLLQARVHNFSLQAMPANASVRVRFYAMVMDTSTNSPVSGTSSFFIGEATAPAVPPFSTINVAPNWVLVNQVFDTTGYGDTSLLFWAITWIDDGTGNMVAELSGKGLKSMPSPAGPGTTLEYTDIAQLDEAYGNNIGIYQEMFQVRQKPTASAAAAVPRPATVPSIAISEVGTDATSAVNGERVLVAARLRVGENSLADGFAVHFVDGHPEQGGKLVAARKLQHLRAGTTHEFRAAFRSRECGSHQLYVVAGPGTRFEHIAKLPAINVTCP